MYKTITYIYLIFGNEKLDQLTTVFDITTVKIK